jgi:hypothetical protein
VKYYEAFGEAGYHSAFFTTFAFSAQAFEDIPFSRLRGAGCRNISVLADASMVNLSFGEFGTPRFAGSLYHLVKVAVPGAFHPKIVLLMGEKKGRLLIGSANLTALGLAGNRELVADLAYAPETPGFAPLFKQALDYVSAFAPPEDPWFPVALDRALQLSPWLPQAQPNKPEIEGLTLILDRPGDTILEQIVAAIGEDEIEHLVVVSPYWDKKLEGLNRLREALGTPPTDVLIEKSREEFPASSFSKTSGIELFDIQDGGRFNHAKLLVARGRNWDHVISGSVNCTMPALLGSRISKGNAEAGIYKRVPAGNALQALGLAEYRQVPIEPSSLVEPTSSAEVIDERRFSEPGTFRLGGSRFSWDPPPNLLQAPTHVAIFDSNGENHWGEIAVVDGRDTSWFVELDLGRPRSARIHFEGGDVSAPGFVIDLDVLLSSTLPSTGGKKSRLADRLVAVGHEDLELLGVLTELETIDLDELGDRKHRFTGERGTSEELDETRQYFTLSYQDFVKARSRAEAVDRTGSPFPSARPSRAADLVSSCLNRLIGLVSKDLSADEEAELQKAASQNLSGTEPTGKSVRDFQHRQAERVLNTKSPLVGTSTRDYSTKIMQAVGAFEARTKALRGKPITTAELVRLRALLQIILAYAQPIGGRDSSHGILPVADKSGHDWPRLAGRLLNQHFGTILALQDLRLEEDENERLRILEYLATAYFASQAAKQAVEARPRPDVLKASIEKLAAGIGQQVNLVLRVQLENQAYFWQLVERFEGRFTQNLGLAHTERKLGSD